MKAADVLIAWTPSLCARVHLPPETQATAGDVVLLAWPDDEALAHGYARRLGACDPCWRAASEEGLAARLFIAFNTLVVRDGIDPALAHAKLLQIDEYRLRVCKGENPAEPPRPLRESRVVALEAFRKAASPVNPS